MRFTITPGDDLTADAPSGSPDYIASKLMKEIMDRRNHLEEFKAYLEGAPIGNRYEPEEEKQFNGIEKLRDMSINNYAKLIVSATTDRLGIIGFRTAAAADETGDKDAARMFDKDGLGAKAQEAMGLACAYRQAYLYVDPLTKTQRIIPPSNAAVISDVTGEPVAAVVLQRHRILGQEIMQVFSRDIDEETGEAKGDVEMHVAAREYNEDTVVKPFKLTEYDTEVPMARYYGKGSLVNGWTWWKQRSLPLTRIPITVLKNKDGKNEFEDNTATIDRINHMLFQRVIIATMQAFRQRAVKGNFPDKDRDGNKIDYEEMFATGPATLWTLPEGAEMWESTPPTFQDILLSVKDDEKALASQTYTPMTYFSDSANMAAEGANLQRENYLSKVDDRRRRFGAAWSRHMSILFEVNGDQERAQIEQLEPIFQPLQMASLNEQTAAFSTLRSQKVSFETAARFALGMTPEEIRRAKQESIQETLMSQLTNSVNQVTPLAKTSNQATTNQRIGGAGSGGLQSDSVSTMSRNSNMKKPSGSDS